MQKLIKGSMAALAASLMVSSLLAGCGDLVGAVAKEATKKAAEQVLGTGSGGSSSSGSKSGSTAAGAFPSNVKVVKSEANQVVKVQGKLEDGQALEDLSWAANSSVACFPATQNEKFRANHVYFATTIPPKSIMKITVRPDSESTDLSLYAYQVSATDFSRVPPNVPTAVSCEADHKWDFPKAGKTQDSSRYVELNATTNPYNVVIGVTGPKGASGGFTLEVDLKQ